MRRFWSGFVAGYVLLAGVGYLVVQQGWVSAAADQKPGRLERWAALHSLHTAIRRDSQQLTNPLPLSDANLLAGAQTYSTNCLVCHGGSDGKPSTIARGLNIVPPQFAKHGVDDDPEGETYWKVEHGIRLTGMPAYGGSLSEEQIWQVTQLVAHLPHLPPAVEAAWNAMPSAAKAP